MKKELNASVNGTEKDYVVFKNKEYTKRYLNDTNYINLRFMITTQVTLMMIWLIS